MMHTPSGAPFKHPMLPPALFALAACFLALADACRPSAGAAVGYFFSNLGGGNWKSATGWSAPLTKAVIKSEFFGLKQTSYVTTKSMAQLGASHVHAGILRRVPTCPCSRAPASSSTDNPSMRICTCAASAS